MGLVLLVEIIAFSILDTDHRETPLRAVTLVVNGHVYPLRVMSVRTDEILKESGFSLGLEDEVIPPAATTVGDRGVIFVWRPRHVRVLVDEKIKEFPTHAKTVAGIIEEQQIPVGLQDIVSPPREAHIFSGLSLTITRVDEYESTEKRLVPFSEITRENASLAYGKTRLIQEGRSGEEEVRKRTRTENGRPVQETIIKRKRVRDPISRIVEKGTKIAIGALQEGPASWYRFRGGLTAASTRFPKGTFVRVRNQENGKFVIVQITDYGPSTVTGRAIDLEADAFARLSILSKGIISVRIEEILADA
ncbi:MAG: G5 domain-containing protein [Parcubacteria group bacterium]|nr:G5 domain-containing protein [Parcubacteria group bacterium]